ncbi:MAG: hypothetical protein EON95_00660 [Caulobacteraceae bacterium]|nr:DUF6491 family protein [Caulobacter sp.]RYF95614.1 MAG: hypothetical protein EON95_00660 [Caulobacteraceae bacterium]
MNKTLIGALLGTALLVTGGASVVQAAPKAAKAARTDCFFNQQVRNFSAGKDDKTLYVRAGRDTYRMETLGRCLDLRDSLNIGLDSHPSSSICSAQDVTIIVHSNGMGVQRCPVRELVKLTPEQVAALPKGERP